MSFTKRTLTPVVNLIGDPLFNFSNPFIQNGVISGIYYTNQQTSYGLPKPSYLRLTANSNTATIVGTPANPLRMIFAYGIHDANTGGEVGAWRTFTAGVTANANVTVTAANTSWIYAEVNENGQPNNPNVWTIDFAAANSLGRTYTTSNARPVSPVGNDVWFDFANNKVEVYNSDAIAWQIKRRVYLGQVAKGGDDYLYTVETWFPDLEYARWQDQYYPPYYLNPWRHFDGVSFTTNGQYIAAQAASWNSNVSIVNAVVGNKIAMNAVANSVVGNQVVGNSNIFLNAAANSTVALSSIANSSIAANLSHQLLANTYVAMSNNLVVNSIASFTNAINGPIFATGGNTVTDIVEGDTIYRVHTFTGSGTFKVHSVGTEANTVEYLIVAGGGGGGGPGHAGGGGAGGYLEGRQFPVSIGSYPVIVGAGGSGWTVVAVAPAGPTAPVSFPSTLPRSAQSGANSSFGGLSAMGGGGGRGEDIDGHYYVNATAAIYVNSSNTGGYMLGGSGGGAPYNGSGPYDPFTIAGNGFIGQGHSGGGYRRTPAFYRGVRNGDTIGAKPPVGGLNPGNYSPPQAPSYTPANPPTGLSPVSAEVRHHWGNPAHTTFNPTMGYSHGGGGGGGAGSDGHFVGGADGLHGTKTNTNAAGDGGRGRYSRITGTLTGYAGGGGGGGWWAGATYGPNPANDPYGISPTVMSKAIAENGANGGIGTEGGGTARHAPGNASLNPTLTFVSADAGTANRGGGGGGAGYAGWGNFAPNPTATYGPAGPVWSQPGAWANGGNGGSGIVVIRYPIAKNTDRWNKPRKLDVQYLVIGGGGGGGSTHSGGAGAGGFKTNVPGQTNGGGAPLDPAFTAIEGVLYPVIVGAGGVGGVENDQRIKATRGNDSQFAQILALGGAATLSGQQGQSFGGSGGGRGHTYNESHYYGPNYYNPGYPPNGYHGTPGPQYGLSNFYGNDTKGKSVGLQGYVGGHGGDSLAVVAPFTPPFGVNNNSCHAGGGGGGAGGVGGVVPNTSGGTNMGQGGAGLASPITGTPVVYAGGGGGSWHMGVFNPGSSPTSSIASRGAAHPGGGGGGDGAWSQGAPLYGVIGQAGTANRGGGGGGGCGQSNPNWGSSPNSGLNPPAIDAPTSPFLYYGKYGGAGGSGIVILRCPREYSAVFSAGCTVANSTSVAGYFVYSVTATSTTSETVKFVRNS